MNKEIEDALHMLLHCSLKDTEYETQKEQFKIVYNHIEELQQKIDKAIKYIESIEMVNCKIFDYNAFLKKHLISLEELRKKVEEDGTLEGHFIEVNKDKLLEILGDKE